MKVVARILDANANRAREAMRVLEEAARFGLNDVKLSGKVKRMRHDFGEAVKMLARSGGVIDRGVELHRDTVGDVGREITTEDEKRRGSVADVVVAAGKRLSEALRCCEEYGKIVDEVFAKKIEGLRYRGYEIEKEVHEKLCAGGLRRQWRVCVLITEGLCEYMSWLDVAKAAVDGGADCLQLREKGIGDGELVDRAGRLVELAGGRKRGGGVNVIVNDRVDVAMAAGADGVHLGQGDLSVVEVRRIVGRGMLVGVSTHNMAEAGRAVRSGCDYCGVGAIFETSTKRRRAAGVGYMERFVGKYGDVPHLAIGGIGVDNVGKVMAAGARGIAASSSVCSARRPDVVVRKLVKAVKGGGAW